MKPIRIVLALAVALLIGAIGRPVLAQVYPFVAGDVTGILGNNPLFPYGLRTTELDQQAAGNFGKRLTLATGAVTWTFTAGEYATAPICSATEESTTGHYVKITAISASAVTFTSDVTSSNTDPIDAICVGNPN